MDKIKKIWKRSSDIFRGILLSKKNLKRDIIIVAVTIFISASAILADTYSWNINIKKILSGTGAVDYVSGASIISAEEIYQEVHAVQETVDMAEWKSYQSKWYGFEVNYPGAGWEAPKGVAGSSSKKWEYRFQFRENVVQENESDPYAGFDVVVYNLSKTKELADTEEFPELKSADLKNRNDCASIDGHIVETGDYPAEEVYFSSADECYQSALFFSFIKGDYIYNLVPIRKENSPNLGDPRVEIIDSFPEFFSVASTLIPIDIVRPETSVVLEERKKKPAITAPKPVWFKVVNGKMVCAKDDDKPGKSKKGKGKHLDMECCLDPDEYPNPWCYYDPKKYGKYL